MDAVTKNMDAVTKKEIEIEIIDNDLVQINFVYKTKPTFEITDNILNPYSNIEN
jgi:hypothetical protein